MINKKISRLCAQFFNARLAPDVQAVVNELYASYFKLDLSEFRPAREYESLQALFTRRLARARAINPAGTLISPCDGTLLSFGRAQKFQAMSIKNHYYDIAELLGCERASTAKSQDSSAAPAADGAPADAATPKSPADDEFSYINIYLSPRDYHHYHAPCDMRVRSARYFRAELYAVNHASLRRHANLYVKNERVVLHCEAKWGDFFMVFVGALNVGRMNFCFDKSIKTNAHLGDFCRQYRDVELARGEHLGHFELGSTILLIGKNLPPLASHLGENKALKFGEILCE